MRHRTLLLASFVLFGIGAPGAAGCGGMSFGVGPSRVGMEEQGVPTPLEVIHEPCDTTASGTLRLDSDGDGRSDTERVMTGGREVCRSIDLDRDGRPDAYVYFDPNGGVRRQEASTRRDGHIDEVSHFQGGVLARKDRETDGDGKLDTWEYYENGVLVRKLRDRDGNGKIDEWSWLHPHKPGCTIVHTDHNGDGKSDKQQEICGPQAASASSSPSPPGPPSLPAPAGSR